MLAKSVKISEDGLTYDFELREKVTFHNGDPFTAEDVRYSWQRGVDPTSGIRVLSSCSATSRISRSSIPIAR